MTMSRSPFSREVFDQILREEIEALNPTATEIYERYATPPFEQPCLRGTDCAVERVFVVARHGNRLLFFDDVEEDFGVGVPDDDGILRDMGTYGPLVAAVLALGKQASD
jgi:hypothetical protein